MKPRFLYLVAFLLFATGCTAPSIDLQIDGLFDDVPGWNQPAPQPYVQPVHHPSPPTPRPAPPDCPDGRCPYQGTETSGIELKSTADAPAVNRAATNEIKGDCPDGRCPTEPPRPAVAATIPAAPTYPAATTRGVAPGTRWVRVPGGPPIPLAPGESFVGIVNTQRITTAGTSASRRPSMPPPANIDGANAATTDPNARQGAFACLRCGRPTVGAEWHEVWADDGTPLTCLCNRCWDTMTPEARESAMRSYAGRTLGSQLSPVVGASIEHAASQSRATAAPAPALGTEL